MRVGHRFRIRGKRSNFLKKFRNFEKKLFFKISIFLKKEACHIIDEFLLGGYLQETSQNEILTAYKDAPEYHREEQIFEHLQEFGLV